MHIQEMLKTNFQPERHWQQIGEESYISTVFIPDGTYSKLWFD